MDPVAEIGEYGFNISNGQIFSPENTFDYMSYCGPQWMSLYQHNRLINHARLDPQFVGDEPIWADKLEYREYWVERDLPYPPEPWKELETRLNPIIAITGKAGAGERQRCIDAGANDYVPKPVDKAKLLAALKPWLPITAQPTG